MPCKPHNPVHCAAKAGSHSLEANKVGSQDRGKGAARGGTALPDGTAKSQSIEESMLPAPPTAVPGDAFTTIADVPRAGSADTPDEVRVDMSTRGASTSTSGAKKGSGGSGGKRASSSSDEVSGNDKALDLPFQPVTLTFNDLHYFVPNPKGSGELELLRGIYGVFRPGAHPCFAPVACNNLPGPGQRAKVRRVHGTTIRGTALQHASSRYSTVCPQLRTAAAPSGLQSTRPRAGVLTALMGASGAGKTTLMDVLADRKTAGRMTGSVKVNGYDKDPQAFARIMGYCEQFDVHSGGTTVEEAVRLSGKLRLGDSVTPEQARFTILPAGFALHACFMRMLSFHRCAALQVACIPTISSDVCEQAAAARNRRQAQGVCAVQFEDFVQQTLRIVELDVIGSSMVGMPGVFGLSGEQFKRLTIAVELVANPSIIFCGALLPRGLTAWLL